MFQGIKNFFKPDPVIESYNDIIRSQGYIQPVVRSPDSSVYSYRERLETQPSTIEHHFNNNNFDADSISELIREVSGEWSDNNEEDSESVLVDTWGVPDMNIGTLAMKEEIEALRNEVSDLKERLDSIEYYNEAL